jgi:hypothetical protein
MVTLATLADQSRSSSFTLEAAIRRALSFPVLLGVVLFAGAFSLAKDMLLDPDTWWHIAVGQRILATHSWPWTDTYSSTVSGAPWIAYEWLGEAAMGAAASAAGLRSATVLSVGLAGILVLLIYWYSALKCGNSKAAFVASASLIPVLGPFFTLRPQLFGAIFLVLTLIVLERFRQGQDRALWFLPPIFLLWVNTHGSFVVGLLILGVTWLCGQFQFSSGGLFAERWTKRQSVELLLASLISMLVLPITPYGTQLAAYPLNMALRQPLNVRNIAEWLPLRTDVIFGEYFVALVLLFFLVVLVGRPRFRVHDVMLAAFGAVMACVHVRFLLIFAIFFSPLWAMVFARWVPAYEAERDHPVVNSLLIAVMAAGIVFFFPSRHDLDLQVEAKYPRIAVEYLASHPMHGTLFNEYGWGGYLISSGRPEEKVFIDGRADLYEYGGVLGDYMSIVRLAPGALRLFDKYGVETCLIRRDSALATALSAIPGWRRVYDDPLAAIYVRKATP